MHPATREIFDAANFLRSHLLRHIQIIGEVALRLSDSLKDRQEAVPRRKIAGMRHVLVHDYYEADWNEVYNIIVRDMPALRIPIQAILRSMPPVK